MYWRTVEEPPPSRTSCPPAGGEGLLERRLDAVGDEVEDGAAFHLDRLVGVVREHEHGVVVRRLVTPTTRSRCGRPTTLEWARTCCGP